jgi:hypothetical protein
VVAQVMHGHWPMFFAIFLPTAFLVWVILFLET